MNRYLKILLFNSLFLLLFLFIFELIFKYLLAFQIISPRQPTHLHYSSLMPDEVRKKYSKEVFDIPDKYKADKSYNWSLEQVQINEPLVSYFQDSYFEDYVNLQNTNKTYRSYKALLKPRFEKIYEHNYEFDSNGLRKVKTNFTSNINSEFVLTFGDSFTFGEGVENGFDYPSILANQLGPQYHVFNYGYHGRGLNDFFEKSHSSPIFFNKDMGKSGVIIWLFIPDHLDRFFCRLQCYLLNQDWILTKPQVLLKNGQPALSGSIKDDQRFESLLYKFLGQSHFLKYLNIQYPERFNNDQLDLFAQTFADLFKNQVQKNFRKRIVFVNLAAFPEQNELLQKIRALEIEVLDLSNIPFPSMMEHDKIPLDGHPTSELYWVLAKLIKKEVFK